MITVPNILLVIALILVVVFLVKPGHTILLAVGMILVIAALLANWHLK